MEKRKVKKQEEKEEMEEMEEYIHPTKKRVLSVSMRPKSWSSLVGQEENISNLKTLISSNRIPHFFLISGDIGTGKTTIAKLLALSIQISDFTVFSPKLKEPMQEDWDKYGKFDISEINAANENSVEFARQLIAKMRYKSLSGGINAAKIVIMDEAHMLSNASQQCLIAETEETSEGNFYIFCTSSPEKIIAALRRRAFSIVPKLLSDDDIALLVQGTLEKINCPIEAETFIHKIQEESIRSPGLILQALDRYLCGYSVDQSILNKSGNSKLDTKAICQSVAGSSWIKCSKLVSKVEKGEIYSLKCCISGYLKTILLKETNQKAMNAAKAIEILSKIQFDSDVPMFLACLFQACNTMGQITRK